MNSKMADRVWTIETLRESLDRSATLIAANANGVERYYTPKSKPAEVCLAGTLKLASATRKAAKSGYVVHTGTFTWTIVYMYLH